MAKVDIEKSNIKHLGMEGLPTKLPNHFLFFREKHTSLEQWQLCRITNLP
jgi:hypothetical protein